MLGAPRRGYGGISTEKDEKVVRDGGAMLTIEFMSIFERDVMLVGGMFDVLASSNDSDEVLDVEPGVATFWGSEGVPGNGVLVGTE